MIVGLAQHREDVLENLFGGRLDSLEASGLDAKTYSLPNIAAVTAMDAPPVSYVWQIGLALESGVTPEEILGLLVAVNPPGGPGEATPGIRCHSLAVVGPGIDSDAGHS